MKKINKPDALNLDGEIWDVSDYRENLDIATAFVSYRGGALSPYEAEQLRDWLTNFINWYYDVK